MNSVISYKDAGVDIEKADALVEKIKAKVKTTYGSRVVGGVGGFACLYDIGNGKLLAAGTDGVGTKLKIAQSLNKHDTIGLDLVAMCVNDVICTGASPLFFMDYIATGKLDIGVTENIIEGVIEGCLQSDSALIGGETAEMPNMYSDGEYDLAGFAVGEVMKTDVIDGSRLSDGDTIIALPSSGIHSNGYSLVHKLINSSEAELYETCLEPTKIYWSIIRDLIAKDRSLIKGMAHITGGGITNIARINNNFDYKIDELPSDIPKIFAELQKRSGLDMREMYRTFNMGLGFVIVTDSPDDIEAFLTEKQEKFWRIGTVKTGSGKVVHKNCSF